MARPFDDEAIYFVYMYLRKLTSSNGKSGTPYYIGKGKNKRHLAPHGKISVPDDSDRIVLVAKSLYEHEAFYLEKHLISYFGRIDLKTGILHNRTTGGDGQVPGPITRQIQSENNKSGKTGMKGKNHSEETKLKMSYSAKGKKKSEEHCKNVSKSKKGKKIESFAYANRGEKISLSKKGKSNGRLGYKHSEESKEKIRAQAGWKHTEETKAKMRAAKKQKTLQLNEKGNNS